MTREEIINGLKMSMELTLFDPSTGEVMEPRQLNDINRTAYEAYKGAIELLEKQPDTTTHDSIPAETGGNDGDRTSGDCISRAQAIDAICTEGIRLERNGMVAMVEIKQWCVGILEALPSAQPERKTGHWIKTARWGRVYYCDQCRNYLDFDGVNAGRGSTNFCPNCGAKMKRGEQE